MPNWLYDSHLAYTMCILLYAPFTCPKYFLFINANRSNRPFRLSCIISFGINYTKFVLVTPHQDATYLYTDPVSAIGFWIAIDDATIENGCLKFARGSHKSGVHRRYKRNPDKTSNSFLVYDSPMPYYQASSFQPVPIKKGKSRTIKITLV